jgi:hypothetical protein
VHTDSSPDNGHGSVILNPIGILERVSDKLHYAVHRSQISVTKFEIGNRSIIDYVVINEVVQDLHPDCNRTDSTLQHVPGKK